MTPIKLILFISFFCAFSLLKAQNTDVYIMTGNAKENLGDLKGALEQYTLALKDDSTSVMAYFNRALVKRKMNDYLGAIADYTMAIKYKPKYDIAFNNRGIVYMLLGKKDEACADWDVARNLDYPDAQKLYIENCMKKSETIVKP